eukprot:GHVH01001570.1.p1 GENE.GHVH01001570.1~~GHVH01001570.1.p1  ORF type:complete len:251 (-),score=35.01 GHVH01001570.1:872-1624(-)
MCVFGLCCQVASHGIMNDGLAEVDSVIHPKEHKNIRSEWKKSYFLTPFARGRDVDKSLSFLSDPLVDAKSQLFLPELEEQTTPRGKHLRQSKRQLRSAGLWGGQSELKGITWQALEPIRVLAKAYLDVILLSALPMASQRLRLCHSDLHGSVLTVAKSLNGGVVGRTGTVVLETVNTIRMVTEDDEVLTVPKKTSTFSLEHNNTRFIIIGMNFCIKPAARTKSKSTFKYTMRLQDMNSRFREGACDRNRR